ncbi:MAG: hypothetical protein ACXADO_10070 [Candidatus Thorarchaeota archaeon]
MKEFIRMTIVAGAAYTLVANPLSWTLWGDASKYIDMANGLPSSEPWSSRPLIPYLAGLLSSSLSIDIAVSFYYINIVLFASACLFLYREHGLTATLVTMACFSPAINIYGKILLDAAIFFWLAVALFIRDRPYTLAVWCVFAAAVHPIALALCGVVLVYSVVESPYWMPCLFPLILAIVYWVWFWPVGSYTVLMMPGLDDLLYTLKMLNALWLGLLFLRRDRESVLIVLLLIVCIGFVPLLTMPARAFPPMALLLGPRLVEGAV